VRGAAGALYYSYWLVVVFGLVPVQKIPRAPTLQLMGQRKHSQQEEPRRGVSRPNSWIARGDVFVAMENSGQSKVAVPVSTGKSRGQPNVPERQLMPYTTEPVTGMTP